MSKEPWPEDQLERVDACPACGAPERDELYTGLPDRLFETTSSTWTLQRCRSCRSGFLDPRPTPASIGRAYAGTYATHNEPAPVEPPPIGAAGRARRSIRNGYLNHHLGYEIRPASPLGAAVPLAPPVRAATDRAFRHLRRPHPGARLLDVGCGNGDFVNHMRWAGWDARGQEIDPDAAAFALASGAPVTSDPVETLAEREAGSYDAVTMSHVIEHVHDPVAFLRVARMLLKPGGRLWVATPNLGSAGHEHYGRDWMALDPPRHLTLFTRDALAGAITAAGYRDVGFPLPWSTGGDIHVRSEILRHGGRPTMTERGPVTPDLQALLRPESAEELVALATA